MSGAERRVGAPGTPTHQTSGVNAPTGRTGGNTGHHSEATMNGIDPEAPYPHGCGPACKGCDPCVCGHPWSDHSVENGCHGRHPCRCTRFDALFKPHIYMPQPPVGGGVQ